MILPDVADEKVIRHAIETEPPRVAQPVNPDLAARLRYVNKRVVLRDLVRGFAVDVNPQDLAQ